VNQITGHLQNPRSYSWNVALSRQIVQNLILQASYENRNTKHDFVVSPFIGNAGSGVTALTNGATQSYREFQVSGRYLLGKHIINGSYVHSKAYGDLNDFFQFFGNTAKPVIQANGQGRLPYDAPNRFLTWGEIHAPWKFTILPVFDTHSGFPYSVQDAYRDYV